MRLGAGKVGHDAWGAYDVLGKSWFGLSIEKGAEWLGVLRGNTGPVMTLVVDTPFCLLSPRGTPKPYQNGHKPPGE